MNRKSRFSALGWVSLLTALGLYATSPEPLYGQMANFLALAFFVASLVSGDEK